MNNLYVAWVVRSEWWTGVAILGYPRMEPAPFGGGQRGLRPTPRHYLGFTCGLAAAEAGTSETGRKPSHKERQRRQRVSTDSFCVFVFLGEVSADPLLLLPEFGGSLSCPSFRVLARRKPNHTNRQTTTRPAAWQPTTKAPAPTPTTGARREKRETLRSVVADVPRNRRARAALAHPGALALWRQAM
jgi:hypothetical protein